MYVLTREHTMGDIFNARRRRTEPRSCGSIRFLLLAGFALIGLIEFNWMESPFSSGHRLEMM